jgi:hypothetical protein
VSAEVDTRPPKRQRGPRPALRPARFEDYDQIMRLEATLSPNTPSLDDWRRLWLSNPLWPQVSSWWPIGWVLETTAGEIVGCMGNIPLQYHFRGERLVGAAGRGWVVSPAHRAFGSALRLLHEHYHQPRVDLVMDTSVSEQASARAGHLSNRIPAGDWETVAYFIVGYRAFATRALQKLKVPLAEILAPPVGVGLQLKDAILSKHLRKPRASFEIEEIDRFDSRFDAFWDELLGQKSETVLAVRDAATLSWHFELPIRNRRLWIYTASRNGRLLAYCIFERKDSGQELRRMRLVDYQTIEQDADLLTDLLAVALRRCVADGVCVLDKSGLGLPQTRAFDEAAPYRRRQPWPFWFQASDPTLLSELRRPEFWEPTEYDGDASIS